MNIIAKIGKYILKKNELKAKRQRARSKANYYYNLYKHIGKFSNIPYEGFRGWKKWNKPGKKQELRLLYKKYLTQQLQAEIEIHELVISTRKELNNIRKEMPFNMPYGVDMILGIQIKEFDGNSTKVIKLNEIEQIVLDQEAEDILLRSAL